MSLIEPPIAPAGTPICCYRCDTQLATLTRPVAFGERLSADAVSLANGEEPYEGKAILCPKGCPPSFYALVGDARWKVA